MQLGRQRSRIGRTMFSIVASLALLLSMVGGAAAGGNGVWSVTGNVSRAEGNTGTSTLTFVIYYAHNASTGNNRVNIDWATSNGTATGGASCATAGVDYVAASGNVEVSAQADSNTNVNITICGDTTVETNETFNFTISGPSSSTTIAAGTSTRTGTITNDDVAAATTTNLTSSLNPSVSGQSVTFTATVAPAGATGTVSFYDGGTLIGTSVQTTGSRTVATAALSVGSHTITATYAGDASYLTSTSTNLIQVVNTNSTSTTLVSAVPNPSNYNQSVTFTATVDPAAATGVVQFYDGGTLIGTSVQTTGNRTFATTTLAVGSHSITARFVANGGYLASTSAAVTQVVNGTNTTTTVTSGTNPAYVGASVTFTATVAPAGATGTVSFYDGATLIGTSAQTTGNRTYSTTTLEPGSHSITAVYAGGGAYNPSTSDALTQTITATQLHLISAVCARYTDVPANRWYTTTPPADDTLGHASELNNSNPISAGNITGNTIAANCPRVGGWTFNLSTGDMGGTTIPGQTTAYTTGAGGMVTVPLNATLFALANHPDGATALWVKESTQPNWAGFGSLHCYSNQLYADNLDTIYAVPVGTADVYCLVYNVQTLTLAKSADPTTFSTLGQTITYTYTVTNTGGVTATPLALPTISDDKINGGIAFNCGAGTLAYNAVRTCTATYQITQADLDAGTVTNTAVAHAGTVTSNQAQATITRMPVLTITALPQSKTYGDTYVLDTTQGVGYSVTGLQAGDSVSGITLTASGGLPANAAVGGYTITPSAATGTGLAKYDIQYVTGILTVNPLAITIGADPQFKTYGEADPELTFGIASGSLAAGDNFTGALTRDAGEDIGSYAIRQGTASVTNASNYTITYSGATLTIGPASLVITASDESMTYGGAVPTPTASYSGFVNGDDASDLTTLPTCVANVALGTTTCSGAVDPNYTITYLPGVLTVNPASLVITASDESMTYGGAVPTPTASYSGFVNGDDASDLTTLPTCVANVALGTTTCSGAVDPNYTITYLPGVLTVNPASLVITASDESMTYGGAVPTPTASYSGFVNGDDASDLTTLPTCVANVALGTTTCSGAVDPNYTITYLPGVLTVNPASLVITASDESMTYGGAVPTPTASYSGFVNGDDASDLTTLPTCVANVALGTTTCSGAVDPNYTITYLPGVLTVNPASLVITASDESMTYGGAVPTPTASYSGFVNGDDASDLTTLPTCVANVALGTTTCSGAVDPNYTITYLPGVLTVNPASLVITASDESMTYGGAVPTPTASYSGFVNGDDASDLTTLPTCVANVALGTTTCSGAVDPNYTITYLPGVLTVNPASLVITASDESMTYGGAVPTPTASYSGFVNGDDASDLTTLPTCVANVALGTTTCSGAVDPNYTITYLPGVLTVNPAENPDITLGKVASSPTYGVAGQVIIYTYTITNTGNTVLGPSQFTVADDKINGGTPFNCGAATTTLATDASVTCTGTYIITQPDLDSGSVTNEATASVTIAGGPTLTDTTSVTINARQNPHLILVKIANRATFNTTGDTIGYTYTLTNDGNVTLYAPFAITDDKITLPNVVVCGAIPPMLAPGNAMTCTSTYYVTAGDDTAGFVTNNAFGTGFWDDGTIEPNQVGPAAMVLVTSGPASVTVTKGAVATSTPFESFAGETATPFESIGGETATPAHSATPPITSSNSGKPGSDQLPIAFILIATAFGLVGLLAVEAQRRSLRQN